MPDRHPLGRSCRGALPLVILLAPYYLTRHGWATWRERRTTPAAVTDPWRLAEWRTLPDRCAIAGCDNQDADQRGPVQLRDGTIFKVCTEHWEPIFRVLGEQASWERTDGSRQQGEAPCLS